MVLDRLVSELHARTPLEAPDSDRAQAAVALILTAGPDRLLLIRRAEREGDPWSGHLAFPGGRRQPGDTDLLATAIRETAEETGVHLDRTWCRAQLDDLVPQTPSLPPIIVRPFVFLVPDAPEPGTSNEVVHSTWLPLAHLIADGVYASRTIDIRGVPRAMPGYQLPEGFLWGMTERILSPVLGAWEALGIDGTQSGRTDPRRGTQ
jgi:8-oxo-dGTP pyrophosphatase MutT (NUDIX family)